ncbi:MAG: glycogen synthase [Microbacteriaceae bacterium]
MRVDLVSREYPPEVYGGAGVHVAELTRALREHLDVAVRCFGAPRAESGVYAYQVPSELLGGNPSISALGIDLQIAQDVAGADLVHSHTWYANAAGQLASMLHGIPHVVTAHSLEPLRPWKAEQLRGGYRISSWIEASAFTTASAVIAVSEGMRRDILRCYPLLDEARVSVVHNGVDLDRWQPVHDDDLVRSLGVDPARPAVMFVGRITRQKGIPYLLRAAAELPPDVQLVLCASAPDTPEILAEVRSGVAELRSSRSGVHWFDRLLSQRELAALLTASTVFACPSIYEPLGIVNLEAMACAVPVVGTATGGIPEVVSDQVTGYLVPIQQATDGSGTPLDPDRFVRDLAAALIRVIEDPDGAARMGAAGRARAEQEFGWARIARRTLEIYRSVL